MALIELRQEYGGVEDVTDTGATFRDFVAKDIGDVFFNESEHADLHLVDGREALIILEDGDQRIYSSHWEAGAKQNFDTGLYKSHLVLYIRVEDYGPKPKVGKELVLDAGTDHKRTYSIIKCQDEGGVYRMTLERIRQ